MEAKAHLTVHTHRKSGQPSPRRAIQNFLNRIKDQLIMEGPEWWDIHPDVARRIREQA
jgi:hypothetical protein